MITNLWRDVREDFCPSNQSQGVRVTYAPDSPGSLPNPKYISHWSVHQSRGPTHPAYSAQLMGQRQQVSRWGRQPH